MGQIFNNASIDEKVNEIQEEFLTVDPYFKPYPSIESKLIFVHDNLLMAENSLPRGSFDLKNRLEFKGLDVVNFRGYTMTLRNAGNFFAGENAALIGHQEETAMILFGVVHVSTNPPDLHGPKAAPFYGEIPSEARFMRLGFRHGLLKRINLEFYKMTIQRKLDDEN